MKQNRLFTLAAIPAAMIFACAASAQSAQSAQTDRTDRTQTPTTQQSTYDNQSTDQNRNQRDHTKARSTRSGNDMDRSTARAQSFSTLAGSKGYVAQRDIANVPWLSSNFTGCDTNHDGQLSRSEFDKCKRDHASMK